MEPFTIQTARLLLRPLRATDVDDVFDYAKDEAFGRYVPAVPHPYRYEDVEAFLDDAMAADWDERAVFAVVLDGRVIGATELSVSDPGTVVFGYAFGRRWWGQGYATEVAEAIVRCAFETYDAVVVWATADARNAASRRVLEKVGLRLDGVLRQRRIHRGERHDEAHFSILRDEWLARR